MAKAIHTEEAFEEAIEQHLLDHGGYVKGDAENFDPATALDTATLFAFLQATQPRKWEKLEKVHGAQVKQKVIYRLTRELELRGMIDVIRKGFTDYGVKIDLAYFQPESTLNPDAQELYRKNILTVTRQVYYSTQNRNSLDMLLLINGLPIVSLELKNQFTGQNVDNAKRQYRYDRDFKEPLFQFKKRTLVHFAVDDEEVYMTTRLKGKDTYYLPFNRGNQGGAGNPIIPDNYRTAYLWENILTKDSLMQIVQKFIHLETEEIVIAGKKKQKETMFFPRYHQLDVVRKLVGNVRQEGSGESYLIQHSAGSGKSKSIAWLAYQLFSLHQANDDRVFDSVIVITDRRVLDQQLQNTIYQIEHKTGVVQKIDKDSSQLGESLSKGGSIIITTLQKFPFVFDKIEALPSRRYAVIVDEAHSSQGGEATKKMKEVLSTASLEDAWETEADEGEDSTNLDEIQKSMLTRGKQKNLSFFAFTATPKGKTLELFGREGGSGKPEAFHTYSMRQAIEEGFILDVLRNYTTYSTWFKFVKTVEDDPAIPKKKGAKALAKFKELHPHNIEQKTEVMVEHFREHVRHRLGGRGKAMVVTASRIQAVRYKLAFERYIQEQGYADIRSLVAFSGTVKDPDTGIEYTEPGMNPDAVTGKPITESQLPERFGSSDYQLLLVANKYQTGFDQPLLCAMYVDKRLDGVQAVQTLSRLNRKIAGKDEPFVLDFVNKPEEIYAAFKPYFDSTSLQESANPEMLASIKHELDQLQIYHWSEVEAFARIFYRQADRQNPADHAHMQRHLQPAVDRFKAIESDEVRSSFRDKLGGYVRMYSFLSQILPYADPDLEILYSYGRFLQPHLPLDRDNTVVKIGNEVELQYYRLQRVSSGAIELKAGEPEGVYSPTDVGTGKAKEEKAPLSEIIQVLNERFGTAFTDEDRLFFDQIKARATSNSQVVQTAMANPLDKFQLGVRKLIEDLMIQRMTENDKIVTRYMDDGDFQRTAFPILAREIFDAIRAEHPTE
ncbi:MAG: type I restriction endonuclease subunit R [Leptospiraceae bacterium]|nr:type I restriction endonuclease subunit R [Leptospiraceae bacterium]